MQSMYAILFQTQVIHTIHTKYIQYKRRELGPRPMMNALLVYTGLLLSPDEWPVVRADIQRCWTITLITQSSHTWHYATHVLRALPSAEPMAGKKDEPFEKTSIKVTAKDHPAEVRNKSEEKLWLLLISCAKSRDCSRQLFNASTWSIHFSLMSFHDNL